MLDWREGVGEVDEENFELILEIHELRLPSLLPLGVLVFKFFLSSALCPLGSVGRAFCGWLFG